MSLQIADLEIMTRLLLVINMTLEAATMHRQPRKIRMLRRRLHKTRLEFIPACIPWSCGVRPRGRACGRRAWDKDKGKGEKEGDREGEWGEVEGGDAAYRCIAQAQAHAQVQYPPSLVFPTLAGAGLFTPADGPPSVCDARTSIQRTCVQGLTR